MRKLTDDEIEKKAAVYLRMAEADLVAKTWKAARSYYESGVLDREGKIEGGESPLEDELKKEGHADLIAARIGVRKIFHVAQVREMDRQLSNEEISFSRFVEMLNEVASVQYDIGYEAGHKSAKEDFDSRDNVITLKAHKDEIKRLEAVIEVLKGDSLHYQTKAGDSQSQLSSLQSELEEKNKEIEKLQAFKNYVHKRLDDADIPKQPNGEHSKNGCRIGDRLDLVLLSLLRSGDNQEINKEKGGEND